MNPVFRHSLVAALGGLCLVASALAQQNPPSGEQGKGGPHGGPPPEALAACKSLASGAACSMTTPHGTLAGTCGGPQGKPLACRPSRPPQGQGQGDGNNKQPPPKPAN